MKNNQILSAPTDKASMGYQSMVTAKDSTASLLATSIEPIDRLQIIQKWSPHVKDGTNFSISSKDTYEYLDKLTNLGQHLAKVACQKHGDFPLSFIDYHGSSLVGQIALIKQGNDIIPRAVFTQIDNNEEIYCEQHNPHSNKKHSTNKFDKPVYESIINQEEFQYFKYCDLSDRLLVRFQNSLQIITNFFTDEQNHNKNTYIINNLPLENELSSSNQIIFCSNGKTIYVRKGITGITKITDHGTEFVEEFQPKIFNQFNQINTTLKIYIKISYEDLIMAYYVKSTQENDDDYDNMTTQDQEIKERGSFHFIQWKNDKIQSDPVNDIPEDLCYLCFCQDDSTLFAGRFNGVITVWKFENRVFNSKSIKHVKDLSDIHKSEITCIKTLDIETSIASGTNSDDFIAIWNFETLELIGRINCHGRIMDMRLIDELNYDLQVFTSHGWYQINKVIEHDYQTIQIPTQITCNDICFLNDGDTYFVASHNTLIRGSLKKQDVHTQILDGEIIGMCIIDFEKGLGKNKKQITKLFVKLINDDRKSIPTREDIKKNDKKQIISKERQNQDKKIPQKDQKQKQKETSEEGVRLRQLTEQFLKQRFKFQKKIVTQQYSTSIQEIIIHQLSTNKQHSKDIGSLGRKFECPTCCEVKHIESPIAHKMRLIAEDKYLVTSASYGIHIFEIDDNNKNRLKGEKIFPNSKEEEERFLNNNNQGVICLDYIQKLNSGSIVASTYDGTLNFYDLPKKLQQTKIKRNFKVQELTTSTKRDSFTSAIAISDQADSSINQYIIIGDNQGQLMVWRISKHLNLNRPDQVLQYEGQVNDVQLIQIDSENQIRKNSSNYYDQGSSINHIISLHQNPNQVIITSLLDFNVTRKIPLQFVAQSFYLVKNKVQIFLTSSMKQGQKDQIIQIDLSFSKERLVDDWNNNAIDLDLTSQDLVLSMRDQNLLTIFRGQMNDEDALKVIEIWVTENRRGIIDCLNSINILIFYSRQRFTPCLSFICQQSSIENLIDSERSYASDYLIDFDNKQGLDTIFSYLNINELDIDQHILEHGLIYFSNWTNDKLFQEPKLWGTDIQYPIFGQFHFMQRLYRRLFNRKEIILLTDTQFISRKFIRTIIDLEDEQPHEMYENVSNLGSLKEKMNYLKQSFIDQVKLKDKIQRIEIMQTRFPVHLQNSSDKSIDFLQSVQNYDSEVFDTTQIKFLIDFKWNKQLQSNLLLLVYFFYICLLVFASVYKETRSIRQAIEIINYLYILNEIFELLCTRSDYFIFVENYINVTGMVFIYLYSKNVPQDPWQEDDNKQYLSMGVFLNLAVFILQLSALKQKLRTTRIIIENSIRKAFQYLVIPLFFIAILALCKFINDDEPLTEYKKFMRNFFEEYQQIFGENIENLHHKKPAVVCLYIVGTLLVNIVCLNILISVVTDNYDIVISRITFEDCKYRAKMMLYQERRNFELFRIIGYEKPMKEKFLMYVRYYEHEVDDGNTKQEDMGSGKLKKLKNKLLKSNQRIIDSIDKLNNNLNYKIDQLAEEVQTIKAHQQQQEKEKMLKNTSKALVQNVQARIDPLKNRKSLGK